MPGQTKVAERTPPCCSLSPCSAQHRRTHHGFRVASSTPQELNPTAPDTEALTTFYTTLYQQRPNSEMAAKFLLQHGLLPGGEDEAKRLVKKFGKAGSSSKSAAPAKRKVRRGRTLRPSHAFTGVRMMVVAAPQLLVDGSSDAPCCRRRATTTTTSSSSQRRRSRLRRSRPPRWPPIRAT